MSTGKSYKSHRDLRAIREWIFLTISLVVSEIMMPASRSVIKCAPITRRENATKKVKIVQKEVKSHLFLKILCCSFRSNSKKERVLILACPEGKERPPKELIR